MLSKESVRNDRSRQSRSEWREDRTGYRSGAPVDYSDENQAYGGFAYGDDLDSLKGLQLELALNKMHHMNQAEIALAKMAENKAKTASVLNLAHQIRADHEKMERKVVTIADDRNVDLERFRLSTHEEVVNKRLKSLNAPEFETAFLRVIERNHDMTAADLRLIRDDLNDRQITQLIDESLPMMNSHKEGSLQNGRAMLEDGELGE